MNIDKEIRQICEEINDSILDYDGHDLLGDGIIDSFDVISIFSLIEERFCISIDAENIVKENFSDYQSIVKMVKNMMKDM